MSASIVDDRVIDNKNIILQDQLDVILPQSRLVRIAVGFFFISGFDAIVKHFDRIMNSHDAKDKVQILISNKTDQPTAEALLEGLKHQKDALKKIELDAAMNDNKAIEIKNTSRKQMVKALEHMVQTDADLGTVEKLIKMMVANKLEIRVYPKEKLHAKAYVFELDNELIKGIGIVGSSNLSLGGLRQNTELNLKTRDPQDINTLIRWFDDLWKESVEFTKDFEIILSKSWAGITNYTPMDIYHKALYKEFNEKANGEFDPVLGKNFPALFEFQKQAVMDGVYSLERHNGVMISDVVGLGKTFIGSAILKYMQNKKQRALIICPSHLKEMWEAFCERYEIDAAVESSGMLSEKGFNLSRKYKNRDLVLVDESHNFNRTNTMRYDNLLSFMSKNDAKAILLTATPYSNKPEDIKNQIMLFVPDGYSEIPPANDHDLDTFFKQAKNDHKLLIEFLQNIMIRRTRKYVLDEFSKEDDSGRKYLQIKNERKYFPKKILGKAEYDIDRTYRKDFDHIVSQLDVDNLTLARYNPGKYILDEYKDKPEYKDLTNIGIQLVALVRHSLLKRMEGSICAFKTSIGIYADGHKAFLECLKQSVIPISKESSREIYDNIKMGMNDDDDLDYVDRLFDMVKRLSENQRYDIRAFDIDRLKHDIDKDMNAFINIRGTLPDDENSMSKNDNKLHTLQKILDENQDKKILIFTESAVTAKYLNSQIKWDKNKDVIYSGLSTKMNIVRRFDPKNNPGNKDIQPEDEIQLLISTDVLSEGVNLQSGQMIINYDFHWNPVRLIQRVGRVDRIGSEHEKITVINFLPDAKIEKLLGLKKTVSSKIGDLHEIIGGEPAILTGDEKTVDRDFVMKICKNDQSILDMDQPSPLTEPSQYEKDLLKLKKDEQNWHKLESMPDGIRSYVGNENGYLVIGCEAMTTNGGGGVIWDHTQVLQSSKRWHSSCYYCN